MILELNGLVSYVKSKAGMVHKSKTEILTENRIKVCVTCPFDLIKDLSDYNDFKFLGPRTTLGDKHELFFQYRPI